MRGPCHRYLLRVTLAVVAIAQGAIAQPCTPTWSDDFSPGEINNSPTAIVTFDDGSGPKLVVANMTKAGGLEVGWLAQWDGVRWSALGSGAEGSTVRALEVFDGGTGNALFVGGALTKAGGKPASNIARWDGADWSPLGLGVNGIVHAMVSHDDGSGPALIAAGEFTSAGGQPAGRIARWNGASWSPLGLGLPADKIIRALAVYDDGTGKALYAGGEFTSIGGVAAQGFAKWTGSQWVAQGGGLVPGPTFPTVRINTLRVFPSVGGTLHVGGSFEWVPPSGPKGQSVLSWNGSAWSTLGAGVSGTVNSLAMSDVGGTPRLYTTGVFSKLADGTSVNHLAAWDGSAWTSVAQGLGKGLTNDASGSVVAQATIDGTTHLYVGGGFDSVGNIMAKRLVRWDGASWLPLGSGLGDEPRCLASYNEPGLNGIYVGGQFGLAGEEVVHNIARWDGADWHDVGGGTDQAVQCLLESDVDGLPALYAGGLFSQPGAFIARWRGALWTPLAQGMNGPVHALAEFPGGAGKLLIAGGDFTIAGATSANRVASWDGSKWSKVGTGLNNGTNNSVRALKAFDDGTGLSLYVGGYFTSAGGVSASRIAKWNGTAWSGTGTFDQGEVLCLEVFDHGTGPALYAGGTFLVADGAFAKRIARLEPAGWKELGGGLLGVVTGLTLAPLPEGARLIVTGGFTQSGSGLPLATRAAWDGNAWSPIAQPDPAEAGGAGIALYSEQSPEQGLYFAGAFDQLGGVPAGRFARLIFCETCQADCDADGNLSVDDFICFQTLFAIGDPTADCDESGSFSIDDFICFQTAFALGC